MAYFRTCALKKWGQVFTRVGLLVDLYSVATMSRFNTIFSLYVFFKRTVGIVVAKRARHAVVVTWLVTVDRFVNTRTGKDITASVVNKCRRLVTT